MGRVVELKYGLLRIKEVRFTEETLPFLPAKRQCRPVL